MIRVTGSYTVTPTAHDAHVDDRFALRRSLTGEMVDFAVGKSGKLSGILEEARFILNGRPWTSPRMSVPRGEVIRISLLLASTAPSFLPIRSQAS